ncbi:thiamine/thiamine pyrophosphate ABC transporter permease ThiP [Halocynthiibacter sp.]|uniref:thiamine/thiamine pyrophosphate ABC transporter permease ThiP n=1 Tax=Halocynthiibacter sp. TaxID=1979210 RepID=UPI003C3FBFAE
MARRAFTITPLGVWGAAAAALLLFLTLGTLIAVALRAEFSQGLGPADIAALKFTLTQAFFSALISTALAIPIARALARRRFPGRQILITLLGAPFILPVIVAVLGLLAVFGRSGLFNQILNSLGIETVSIYGFSGVLLAHVFFNLPLATRLMLQAWLTIPGERFRLAQSLGLPPRAVFRQIELPMLREIIPGIFAVIFLICTTSFAVALTLGGGPRATTIELAIYQALRSDFDPGKAAMLAGIQFLICSLAATTAWYFTRQQETAAGLDRSINRLDVASPLLRGMDAFWLTLAAAFVVLPLLMVIQRGLMQVLTLPEVVWLAAGRSVMMALLSAIVMLILVVPLALIAAKRRRAWPEAVAYLSVSASPLVIGTGLFILLNPHFNPRDLALPITILVNAAMAVPFALRALLPAIREVERNWTPLADQLGITGLARFRLVILPRVQAPLGFALGLTAALSMGDLGVVALFADPEAGTLPLMIYRLMGAYRMDQAAGAALLLLCLSLAIFMIFERGGQRHADT